jgi:diphthine synthase
MGLYLIGAGLGSEKHLTREAMEAIDRSQMIIIDSYTGPLDPRLISYLHEGGREVRIADREMLEDGATKIVDMAREMNICIIVQGDPFIATTHQAIRIEAWRKGVECRSIHGVSIVTASISESGLHLYKFGRTATMPKTDDVMQLTQPYNTIMENLSLGLHTLILLDTKSGGLRASDALEALWMAENAFKAGVVSDDLLIIALARLGWDDERVAAGRLAELRGVSLPPPPHTLIIPGELHFTEREYIETYSIDPSYVENYKPPNTIKERVEKYSMKCRRIINGLDVGKVGREYLDMVSSYVDDSLNFLMERDIFNSLLAIGYAEGLLDSLRLRGLVDFQW